MIEKQVMLADEVLADIEDISDFIIAVSRPSHAERYIFEILAELNTLSYLGAILQKTKYDYPKRFHPEAKMIKLHNKPLCAIFHIDGDFVIVDRIFTFINDNLLNIASMLSAIRGNSFTLQKNEYGKETTNITTNRNNVHYGIYGMRPWNFSDI